ncbi:MAG: hypothetical protein OES14_06695 [Nitrosopumilus sp.]|jgi:hypothetical protein|nr:hypothetical protein [Nitrosopumilus sp.]
MSQQPDENRVFDQKCRSLLDENGVRFVGVINSMGRQVAGGYRDNITPLVDTEEHKISLEHALEILITKDLDESLGSIDSIITRRKKVTMITIPMERSSLLISVERDSDAEKIVNTASKLFEIR